MRSYMEVDPDAFEKLTTAVQSEEKIKSIKSKDMENKWANLEARFSAGK